MRNLILFLLAAVMVSCSQRHRVEGHIEGLTNDTILRTYAKMCDEENAKAYVRDTIYATNGSFAFDLPSDEAYVVRLYPNQAGTKISGGVARYPVVSDIELYLNKDEQAKIEGSIDSTYLDYEITGAQIGEDWSAFRAETMPLYKEQASVLRAENLSREEFFSRYQKVKEQIHLACRDYMRAHPDRALSAKFLSTFLPDHSDSVKYYYDMLTDEVKESILKSHIKTALDRAEGLEIQKEAAKRIIVGNPAPDFTLELADGTKFTLSSLRGKYALLDFWGSWCGWCIKGFPDMKKAYAQHKDRMEIVGVDCSDTREKWIAAVKEHQLPWTNVYHPKDVPPAEDLTNIYNISGFPTKILVDPEGNIAAICVGEDPAFYDELKEKVK